jgi:hypothetical protein
VQLKSFFKIALALALFVSLIPVQAATSTAKAGAKPAKQKMHDNCHSARSKMSGRAC